MYHDMNGSDKFNSEQKQYRQKIQAGFHFYKVKKLQTKFMVLEVRIADTLRKEAAVVVQKKPEGDFQAAGNIPFCVSICVMVS